MTKKLTTEEFIERAKAVHGDKYDYSKTEYFGQKTKVTITCRTHGDFKQASNNHLGRGAGCRQCGMETKVAHRRLGNDKFAINAERVHGTKYSYEKVKYNNYHEKVDIVCQTHGVFSQSPKEHIRGRGCPKCHSYTGKTLVYLVHIESNGEEMLKIGITNHNTKQRFNDYHHPEQHITEIATLEFKEREDAKTIEAFLHTKHKRHQFTPKVKFAGHTECFNIEALDIIKQDFGV